MDHVRSGTEHCANHLTIKDDLKETGGIADLAARGDGDDSLGDGGRDAAERPHRVLLEREWHRLLTTVQGVGAKAALSILSTLGPDGVARAISLGDWGSVKAAQGVGPKLAQRVVNELKSKAPEVMALGGTLAEALIETEAPGAPAPGPAAAKPAPAAPTAAGDQAAALSALVNLGYGPADASTAVAQAAADGAAGEPALIRAALRLLAPKG